MECLPAHMVALWARSAGFYPVKCTLGLSFYEHSTGTVLLPLLFFLSFALVEAPLARRAGVSMASYKSTLGTCAVLVAYLLYPSVVEAVLTGTHTCHYPFGAATFSLLLQCSCVTSRWRRRTTCRRTWA